MNLRACIFDLDGTLIDSEPLKTLAHVRAVSDLAGAPVPAAEIVAAVTGLIGVPTRETALELLRRFDLGEAASARKGALGLSAPWEVYSLAHRNHYQHILDQPGILDHAQFATAVELLRQMRVDGYLTALGSMSWRREVERTLDILNWRGLFDAVLAGDDVSAGKPDPEIYLRLAAALGVDPVECLVVEDSPSGIGAALAAGMRWLAVPNDLTRGAVQSMSGLDRQWIVEDSAHLLSLARRLLRS